jgi:uncharacterized protein (TIGR02246 family)
MTPIDTAPADKARADAALHELFARMCRAWTGGDAAAYGACFTVDVDYVGYDGYHTKGRKDMVVDHDRLFRGVLLGSALVGDVTQLRYLTPDVAIVHGTASVLTPWRTELPKSRRSLQTMVAVRHDDEGWLFTAFQNGRVRPVGIPAVDSFPSRAAHLIVRLTRALGMGRRD